MKKSNKLVFGDITIIINDKVTFSNFVKQVKEIARSKNLTLDNPEDKNISNICKQYNLNYKDVVLALNMIKHILGKNII
jgi:hypothetical protein